MCWVESIHFKAVAAKSLHHICQQGCIQGEVKIVVIFQCFTLKDFPHLLRMFVIIPTDVFIGQRIEELIPCWEAGLIQIT